MQSFDAEEVVAALPWTRVAALLGQALRDGEDMETLARQGFPVARGELLLMPAQNRQRFGVKVLSAASGDFDGPRVQGQYLLFSQDTLAPLAVIDAKELTLRRTAGMSALAAVSLRAEPGHLSVFGTGPQALAHVLALAAFDLVQSVSVHGRTESSGESFATKLRESGFTVIPAPRALEQSSIVVCATTAREPLFGSALLPARATVLAVGSHTPNAREVDTALVRDGFTIVDGVDSARREAGDIIIAEAESGRPLVNGSLSDLVLEKVHRPEDGLALFKSVGEGWQDLALTGEFSHMAESGPVPLN